jgi:hypothetical protein
MYVSEAGTQHAGPKILKMCIQSAGRNQGEKFGELLLKQVLWFHLWPTALVEAE